MLASGPGTPKAVGGGGGGCGGSGSGGGSPPPKGGTAPAPALNTRRSSDSTVGVADSPNLLPEGLKTDEEDYSGRRPAAGAARGGLDTDTAMPSGPTPSTPPAPGSAGAGPGGGGDEDQNSPCESTGGETTQAGSFCLPGTSRERAGGGGHGHERERAGAGGGVGDGRTGVRDNGDGVGDDDDDADALEMASEGGLTAVTTTETPAGTTVVMASALAKAGRVGGGGGAGGRSTAAPEQGGGGGGGGGCGGGGRNLDAYREPEGSDWKEVEDWHWQGLQLAGGKGEAEIRSRLQVSGFELLGAVCICGKRVKLAGWPGGGMA